MASRLLASAQSENTVPPFSAIFCAMASDVAFMTMKLGSSSFSSSCGSSAFFSSGESPPNFSNASMDFVIALFFFRSFSRYSSLASISKLKSRFPRIFALALLPEELAPSPSIYKFASWV